MHQGTITNELERKDNSSYRETRRRGSSSLDVTFLLDPVFRTPL